MADISKINAVLIANIAEIDDVLAANIAKVNGLVFSTAPAFTGLLDTYTGAAAAYSTRRLYGQYTGAALRVREDSGDTETDIGFDSNGDLDTAAIATHCGSANGYVTKWYGQESSGGTGSGNDAEQSTGTAQPQIYNGTAVITENGKPALNFPGEYSVGGLTFNTNDVGVFVVCKEDTGHQAYATAVNLNPGSGVEIAMAYRTEQILYSGTVLGTGTSDITQNLVSLYADNSSNDVRGYIDGTQLGTTTTSSNAGTSLTIGNLRGISSTVWNGTIQEMVFYASSSKSDHSGIEGNQNAHYQIGNFGTPTSGLLYDYSGAAAAYSVRQLANTAALAMRIREDGTDTETDIGFDANGDLDTAAISSHCGANNGYVVTWYDQAGSQVDATQSTTTRQPQIYNGTAVITENGKPAPQFTGDYFNLSLTNTASNYSLHVVTQNSSTNSFLFDSYTGRLVFDGRGGTRGVYYDGSWKGTMHSGTGQQLQSIYAISSSSGQSYVDGSQINTGLSYTQTAIGGNVTLGCEQTGTAFHISGTIQEFILYASDETSNRSGIETNINNYFSIY